MQTRRRTVPFSDLLGKVLISVNKEQFYGTDTLTFKTKDGETYQMTHDQDCCESVELEDVAGDLDDLLNSPITLAEEATSGDQQPGLDTHGAESFTWTFYKLATVNGYVTLRWFGASNGYYSEAVDFRIV